MPSRAVVRSKNLLWYVASWEPSMVSGLPSLPVGRVRYHSLVSISSPGFDAVRPAPASAGTAAVVAGRGGAMVAGAAEAVEPSSESSDFCSSARRLPSSFASRTVSASALVSSTGDAVVAGSSSAVASLAVGVDVRRCVVAVASSCAVASSSWPSAARPIDASSSSTASCVNGSRSTATAAPATDSAPPTTAATAMPRRTGDEPTDPCAPSLSSACRVARCGRV